MSATEIKRENLINLYNENGEQHGYWENYYDNGQLAYKGNYVNGQQHGYWEEYYSNGQLAIKGNYVNGQEHGLWESYYINGQLSLKTNYDMGKKVKEVVESKKSKNQTAVEWLVEQIFGEHTSEWQEQIEEAKAIEKEQTREAAHEFHFNRNFTDDAFNEWYFRKHEAPEGMITTIKIEP